MNKQPPMANPETSFVSRSLGAADQATKFFVRIEAFNLAYLIESYAKEYHLDGVVAHDHFVEFKRDLAIGAATNESIHMAGPVDDAWHTFLLFTRNDPSFADMPGTVVHHAPNIDHEASAAPLARYTPFLQIYELACREPPPPAVCPCVETSGLLAPVSRRGCGSQCGGGRRQLQPL